MYVLCTVMLLFYLFAHPFLVGFFTAHPRRDSVQRLLQYLFRHLGEPTPVSMLSL